MANWVLKFISGKYQGGEFPLEPGQEYTIGRSSESSLVLVEDMVSRQHARIFIEDGAVKLADLDSTNGSFVNGERVRNADLAEGDRILFGTSIIKLVRVDESDDAPTQQFGDTSDDASPAAKTITPSRTVAMSAVDPADLTGGPKQANPASTPPPEPEPPREERAPSRPTISGGIAGLLEEVALPDLLQLFAASRKNGLLRLQSDREALVYLKDGRIVHCVIEGADDLTPEKAAFRVLTWTEGTFVLEPPVDREFENPIEMSTEALMMEAMRLMDEMDNLRGAPPKDATLSIVQPLGPPLRALTPELLDSLQLVINHQVVAEILDASLASDLETMQDLVYLIKHDYVAVS